MNDAGEHADAGAVRGESIVLIGYRGCGKTSVARTLAAQLGWDCVDTDERVEARSGRSIRDIFAQDGESEFRRLEAAAIAEALRGMRRVLSVGGGAVLSAANRDALRGAGVCVWLKTPAEELYRRMQADPRNADTRPPLTGRGGLEEVRHLLARREPLYAAVADHVVETAGRSVEQVVRAVRKIVAGRLGRSETP